MILTDNEDAVNWFKRARYEGRGEVLYHQDNIKSIGWNMYMTPEQAARGLIMLMAYPKHAEDQIEEPPYRDLSEFKIFENVEKVK